MFRFVVLLLAFCAVLVAAQTNECSRSSKSGGFKVVTTTTIIDDSSSDMMYMNGRHGTMDRRMMPSSFMMVSDDDFKLINSSWTYLKKKSGFAPKVFMRYFKAKPEAQKLFPMFANVNMNDLNTNQEFLHLAYTCVTSLNYILPHINSDLVTDHPSFKGLKNNYNESDLKKFGGIWLAVMQEEMGSSKFTPEVREAWKNLILAFTEYASNK